VNIPAPGPAAQVSHRYLFTLIRSCILLFSRTNIKNSELSDPLKTTADKKGESLIVPTIYTGVHSGVRRPHEHRDQAVVPKAAQIRSRWRPHSRYMNHNADIYRKLRAMS